MEHSRFTYVIHIRTRIDRLWEALTRSELTRQYWHAYQECAWTEGADWKLFLADGRLADHGTVLAIAAPHRLEISWQHQLNPTLRAEGISRLRYQLDEAGETVKLTVEHEMERPHSRLIAEVSTGWPMILSSLKTLLETGKPL